MFLSAPPVETSWSFTK